MVTYENNHTNYYEAIWREQEALKQQSTSQEGGKGVLISESRLQTHSVSLRHHLLNQRILERAKHGRLFTPFPAPSAIVNSAHKLCSSYC